MNTAIVFVLGAGFSAPFGVPTMKPFLQSFRDSAAQKYPLLGDTLEKHFEKLPDESDVEALLSSLGSAEELSKSLPPGQNLSQELVDWEEKSRTLKAHLVSYIIERCERFDRHTTLESLSPLLQGLMRLKGKPTICFATTNYDRIIEFVTSNLNLPFADGFDQSKEPIAAPWTGKFEGDIHLYKLHGSVTYYGDRDAQKANRFFRLDRGYPLPSPNFRLTREGNALEPLMVLPTLEKETLDDPYGQLNHRFAEMMAKSRIVVAIGTSLRDKDLISAFNYNSNNCVVLLVDSEPSVARDRIEEVTCVPLKADTKDFLSVSTERLVALVDDCIEDSDFSAVTVRVEEFAKSEIEKLSQWMSMSAEQREALAQIQSDCSESTKLKALQALHGIADVGVVQAISKMCNAENSPLVRKASAGCLGLSGTYVAVRALRENTVNDPLPDVRLEGYLALKNLGGKEAFLALDEARSKWPNDRYFDMRGGANS